MADETRPDPLPGPQHPGQAQSWGAREDAPTEWIGTGPPPPDEPAGAGSESGSGDGGRRRWIAPVAVIAAVVLIGGGAFAAYSVLSGGGSQPAVAIPASALAYGRIDLDPSADQKINMVRLLRNVPEFEEETGITSDTDDLRKRLFEKALEEEEGCGDLSYDDDIKPWIGERAGFAVLPPDEGSEPDGLVVLQVSDEDATRDGIAALQECSRVGDDSEDEELGLAFVDDYALLAETQDLADQFAQEAEDDPLADSDAFQADVDALDGEGLASFWVDLDAVVEFAEESDPDIASPLTAYGFDDWGSMAVALRAKSDAMELVSVSDGDLPLLGPGDGSDTVGDVQQLPDSTLMALGFTGGGDAVTKLWERLGTLSEEELEGELGSGGLDGLADQFEAQYGITLPDDIAVLLGDEFTLALDSEGFDSLASSGEPDPSAINLGARMRTDGDAVRDLVSRVQDLVAVQFGVTFDIAEADLDDGIVLAANDGYAQKLAEDGSLGDSDVFRSAVADAGSASSVFFLDFDKISEVSESLPQGQAMTDDVSAGLEVVRAFGFSVTDDGDYVRSTARLVFD